MGALFDKTPEAGDDGGGGADDGGGAADAEIDLGGMEAMESGGEDSFDSFSLDGTLGGSDALPGLDDFNIPGVDSPPVPGTPTAEEQIEAMQLSESELQSLLQTLSSYPLNVRIACEEAIVEEVITPPQLSALTKLLINRGTAGEAARLVSKILNRRVLIPKGYKTGEALEEERSTFAYIFVHTFFPIIRLFFVIATLAACVSFLVWKFIVVPVTAENLYKKGYELIATGDPTVYPRANQYFFDAFAKHPVKEWFYRYAERFRDEKQYRYAREKYDELLRYYPHDKKGVLDYATMEANEMRDWEKADRLVRAELLDYATDDREGLLLLGDINLDWADIEPARYEEARRAYARLLDLYGWTDPILERMLLYFIRTDKLFEVLPLQQRFMASPKSKISAATLAELGGYLLDKRMETPQGVPDENIERIEGIKDILLRAEKAAPELPEPHYHLARYYHFYSAPEEERWTLEAAAAAFDTARRETAKRTGYRIDTQRRLAEMMTKNHEFFEAENALVKGIGIYEDAVRRGLLKKSADFGRLYADLGDIEYFVKDGSLESAARYYLEAEASGWLPPELQYRLGNTYYRRGNYSEALRRFLNVSREMQFTFNRKLLYALGNTAFENADYSVAEGYYRMLLDLLAADRARIPAALPDGVAEHQRLIERLVWAQNNMAVTMNRLAVNSGRADYRLRAELLLSDAIRAADALDRDQKTMIRPALLDPRLPGTNRPYLNLRYILYPEPGAEPLIFPGIDEDVLEPSEWEERKLDVVKSINPQTNTFNGGTRTY